MKRSCPAIVISAPSGGGKGTVIRSLLARDSRLALSVSATTRPMRFGETNGVEYYFLSEEDFREKIRRGDFLEWEEVHPGKMYGTLRSELDRLWNLGKVIIFEVDVNGAMHMRENFGDNLLSIFLTPPSIEVLKERLLSRGVEDDSWEVRLNRVEYELAFRSQFDVVVVNDVLDVAVDEVYQAIIEFLDKYSSEKK